MVELDYQVQSISLGLYLKSCNLSSIQFEWKSKCFPLYKVINQTFKFWKFFFLALDINLKERFIRR